MKSYLFAGASALALGACAQALTPLPDIASQRSAAEVARTSPLTYRDPFAGYTDRSPSGPRDWRQVNDEQSEAK
ncbi:MAG: hypothetical protein LPK02_00365 [Rhodobacterales bacterium]|nr:hypothetical protein [Rhodobacterales bacterium]MDX5411488.1 hypothetical protein [Rhodobacterales bacterium]